MSRLLALLVLALPCLAAEPFKGEHVEVELVAEHGSVRHGATAFVGVRFRLDPGWHVYWRNAGEVGLPPRIQWRVPEGVSVGPVLWPAPERIVMGEFVTFGFSGEVLLSAEVRVPGDFPGDVLPLAARVDWQACDDRVCVSDGTEQELRLPVRDAEPAPGSFGRLFEATRRALPRPLDGVEAAAKGEAVELRVPRKAERLAFFPVGDGVIDYRAPQRVVAPGVLSLTPAPGAARLEGVVVAWTGGTREAFAVDVPLRLPAADVPSWGAAAAIVIILAAGSLLVRRKREGESE